MYDENGNVNGTNETTQPSGLVLTSNGSNSNSPAAVATTATGTVNFRFRPNQFSPEAAPPPSLAFFNLQNGYASPTGGGQMVNQQLNRMALISHVMNAKDPTWLQVEVCREFQRGQCSRNEQECKFAHPPPHVEIQNGRVVSCYDNIKNRCTRDPSACKFLHPPQHLKEQVLTNGRNNFALRNWLTAQMSTQAPSYATSIAPNFGLGPFATAVPTNGTPLMPSGLAAFNPYAPCALNPAAVYQNVMIASTPEAYGTVNGVLAGGTAAQTPMSMATIEQAQKAVNVRMDRSLDMAQNSAAKRAVLEKGGAPVYQPVTHSVNSGAALQCQQFVSAYPPFPTSYVPWTFTGPAPNIPRL